MSPCGTEPDPDRSVGRFSFSVTGLILGAVRCSLDVESGWFGGHRTGTPDDGGIGIGG